MKPFSRPTAAILAMLASPAAAQSAPPPPQLKPVPDKPGEFTMEMATGIARLSLQPNGAVRVTVRDSNSSQVGTCLAGPETIPQTLVGDTKTILVPAARDLMSDMPGHAPGQPDGSLERLGEDLRKLLPLASNCMETHRPETYRASR